MKQFIFTLLAILIMSTTFGQLKIDRWEMNHKKEYECHDVDGTMTFTEDSIVSYIHCPELSMKIYDLENYNGYIIGYMKKSKQPVIIYRYSTVIFINWKNYSYRLHIKA
jgi:hypothetical protein